MAVSFTTLFSFNETGAWLPSAGFIADANGNLFSTTRQEGTGTAFGTVFEIAKTATGYASSPTILATFDGVDGQSPVAGLIADANGDLFGTAEGGGSWGFGTVFEIAKTATGYASSPTVLVNFTGADGQYPRAGLLADANGNLFGTTSQGGSSGFGTVFEIAKTADGYASSPTVLVSFNGADGRNPAAGLIADANGNLFGTTEEGGSSGFGTVFEIAKTAGGYASSPTVLVNFNRTDGAAPDGALLADANGDLFGTTSQGGSSGFGTVFELAKTTGGYASSPTTLVSFNYAADGASPPAGLIADANGNLFGTTMVFGPAGGGTAFEIPKTATGYASSPTTLVSFSNTNTTDGHQPAAGLFADANGNLLGTTNWGGSSNVGTAFEIAGAFDDLFVTLSSNSPLQDSPISVSQVTDAGAVVTSGLSYQWQVNGVNATGTGATTATYTPAEADEGGALSVIVTYAGDGDSTTATAANAVAESPTENASFTVAGLVNGHAAPDHALTATVTEPDAPASGITYTWQVDGVTKLTGVDAAGNTYTPHAGDAGKSLTLSVSFTDTHGFAESGTGPVGSVASATPYDLNGDGISDLVFQNNGTPGIWLWNGSAPTAEVALTNPGASWHIVASRDVNGDGNADLIWQNSDGTPGVWLMNGTTPIAQTGLTNPGSSWHIVAAGDLNGDGNADLVWQNTDGTLGVWEMNGTTPIAETGLGNPGSNWKVVGTADYNGDGNDDILLQNSTNGNLQIDLMNGTSIASTVSLAVGDPSWHAVSTGTFNGEAAIAWQNNNGAVGLWLMNGTAPAAETGMSNPGAGWQLVSVDHFTPNGQPDL
ncbi:MAG: VCBS repeat-containing protein, partial [Hyphomicrobiales bacterium]|nr:VCBS repeat-containing protein [Hyphomicrobiales bacterium]